MPHGLMHHSKPTDRLAGVSIGDLDWNDPDGCVAGVSRLWESRGWKEHIEHQAIRNLAMVAGDQWHNWNAKLRKMERDTRRPHYDIRLVFNFILPFLKQNLARLIRRDPVWNPKSPSDDDGDRIVSRLLKTVMGYYYRTALDIPSLLQDTIMAADCMKVAFWEVLWDDSKGPKLQFAADEFGDPELFTELFGEEAAAQGMAEMRAGDAVFDLAYVFEMNVWPFNITRFDQAKIWVRSKPMTHREAADEFNLSVDQVIQYKVGQDNSQRDVFRMLDWQQGDAGAEDIEQDIVIVHRAYVLPSGDYPDGVRCAVIGETPVREPEPIPFRGGRIPFFVFQSEPLPFNLWGTCPVDQLLGPQLDTNMAVSDESNVRNRAHKSTIVRFRGDGLDGKFSNAPAAIVEVRDKQHMPEILVRPPLGSEHQRSVERNLRFAQDIAGVSAVDLGRTDSSGVRSGTAITALQDQTNEQLLGKAERLNVLLAESGSFLAELLQANIHDERLLHIVGKGHTAEVVRFRGEDLQPSTYGDPNAPQAIVEVTSFRDLPTGKGGLLEGIQAGVELGFIRPGAHDDLFFRALGIGEFSEFYDRDRVDFAQASAEIEQWRQGKPVGMPSKYDDHAVHYDVHSRWARGGEYRDTIRAFPQLAQEIDQHIFYHEQGLHEVQQRLKYMELSADIRAWQEIRARWMVENPEIAQAFFALPMGAATATAAVNQATQPKDEPGGKAGDGGGGTGGGQ